MGWDVCLVGSGRGSERRRGEEADRAVGLHISACGLWLMTLSGLVVGCLGG